MKDDKTKDKKKEPRDANAKRKRISVDEEGKPILKEDARKTSPPDFKPSPLKEE